MKRISSSTLASRPGRFRGDFRDVVHPVVGDAVDLQAESREAVLELLVGFHRMQRRVVDPHHQPLDPELLEEPQVFVAGVVGGLPGDLDSRGRREEAGNGAQRVAGIGAHGTSWQSCYISSGSGVFSTKNLRTAFLTFQWAFSPIGKWAMSPGPTS